MMELFKKHTQFNKEVDESKFNNQQIETIVHHFRQKIATLGNNLSVVSVVEDESQDYADAMASLNDTLLDLEQMLSILESKYEPQNPNQNG